jgi:arylsulfatase A-like enzyme
MTILSASPDNDARGKLAAFLAAGWLLGLFYGAVKAFFFFDRFVVVKNVFVLPSGRRYAVFALVLTATYGALGACCGAAASLVRRWGIARLRNPVRTSAFFLISALTLFGYGQAALYLNGYVFAFKWGQRAFFRGHEVRAALLDKAVLAENFVLLCAACVAGILLYRRAMRAGSPRERIAIASGSFFFLSLAVPVNFILPRLLSPISCAGNLALALACDCLGRGFARLVHNGVPRRIWGLSAGCVLAIPLFLSLWRDRESKALMMCRASVPVRYFLRAVDLFFDYDRDGFSPLTPVGDCDNWDRSINVLSVDIPGNGIDEDCYGGDFTRTQLKRWRDEEERRRAHNREAARDALALRGEFRGVVRPNIFLICVDALRSDHLSLNGYPRRTTPNLDSILKRSTYFPRCVTPSCSTLTSMPGILNSRYRLEFGEGSSQGGAPTIQSLLGSAGYRTAVFQSVTDPGGHFEAIEREGFDYFFSPNQVGQYRIHNDELNERVMRFVSGEKTGAPLFVLFIYGDTHGSYYAPPPFSGLFGTNRGSPTILIPRGTEARDMERSYDRAVAYTDHMVATLIGRLKETGLADRSIIVLTSDHGEEFYEHGGLYHVSGVYQEVTTVPLAFILPSQTGEGRRYEAAVQSLDLMPTLLPLAGVGVPDGVQGWSLVSCLAGKSGPPARTILIEATFSRTHYVMGIIQDDWKLIQNFFSGTTMLFNTAHDPGEKSDCARTQPAVAARMKLDLFNLKSFLSLPGRHPGGGGV